MQQVTVASAPPTLQRALTTQLQPTPDCTKESIILLTNEQRETVVGELKRIGADLNLSDRTETEVAGFHGRGFRKSPGI